MAGRSDHQEIEWDDWTDAKEVSTGVRADMAAQMLRDGFGGRQFSYILGGDALVIVCESEDSYGNPCLEVFDTKLLRRSEVPK